MQQRIQMLDQRLAGWGRRTRDVAGNGSCFFLAGNLLLQELGLAEITCGDANLQRAANKDRAEVVKRMRAATAWDTNLRVQIEATNDFPGANGKMAKYFEYMAKPSAYADSLVVMFWQARFKTRLTLVSNLQNVAQIDPPTYENSAGWRQGMLGHLADINTRGERVGVHFVYCVKAPRVELPVESGPPSGGAPVASGSCGAAAGARALTAASSARHAATPSATASSSSRSAPVVDKQPQQPQQPKGRPVSPRVLKCAQNSLPKGSDDPQADAVECAVLARMIEEDEAAEVAERLDKEASERLDKCGPCESELLTLTDEDFIDVTAGSASSDSEDDEPAAAGTHQPAWLIDSVLHCVRHVDAAARVVLYSLSCAAYPSDLVDKLASLVCDNMKGYETCACPHASFP